MVIPGTGKHTVKALPKRCPGNDPGRACIIQLSEPTEKYNPETHHAIPSTIFKVILFAELFGVNSVVFNPVPYGKPSRRRKYTLSPSLQCRDDSATTQCLLCLR